MYNFAVMFNGFLTLSDSVISDIYVQPRKHFVYVCMKSSGIIFKNVQMENNVLYGGEYVTSESSFTVMNSSISKNTFSNSFMIMDGNSTVHIVNVNMTKNIGLGSSNFIKAQHSRIILENTFLANNTFKGKFASQHVAHLRQIIANLKIT